MTVGAFALAAYSWTVCVLLKKLLLSSWIAIVAALVRLVRYCTWCIGGPLSTLMIVQIKPSAMRQTRWYEYLVKFVLSGAMTVAAGLIAAASGQSLAAYFSRFPRSSPQARF